MPKNIWVRQENIAGSHENHALFFKIFFGGHESFFGATDTPVLDFWWCLLWVSKPELAALFKLCGGVHVTHSLRFTSGATPADLFAASMAAKLSLPHTCEALVGLKTGSYHVGAHSVRSGRHSTDWAILAWLQNLYSVSHESNLYLEIIFEICRFYPKV